MSTALVASLTVPVDELAGIVGSRLLRDAIEQLSAPTARWSPTAADMEEFLIKAGVHPVLRRHGSDFAEPEPATRRQEVTAALNDRRESMRVGIDSLRAQLGRDVPQLVAGFDPSNAARELLGQMDVFRLQRVVFGHPELSDEVEQGGVTGCCTAGGPRRAAPAGHGAAPPASPGAARQVLPQGAVERRGRRRCPQPAERRGTSGRRTWRGPSSGTRTRRSGAARSSRLQRDLAALTRALIEFARQDEEDFDRRSAELYRKRVGVSYLLPAGAGRMEQFYQQVVRRLLEQLGQGRADRRQLHRGRAAARR